MKKLVLLFSFARADLPVHCIHEEIVGDWTLHLGKPSRFRSFCGHAHPDNETLQPNTDEWLAMNEGYKIYDISLNQLNGATMHGDKPRDGKWTVIYDEGWEVKFDSLAFFAFSRFDFVNGKNVSQCGGTMVGWYNDNRDDWGCYVAVKKGLTASKLKTKPEKLRAKERKRISKPAKVAFVQSNENVEKVLDLAWHEAKVKEINAQGSTWKAKVYSKWVGKTYRELNMHAGISRGTQRQFLEQSVSALVGLKEALTFIEKDQCEDEFAHRYPKKGDLLPNLLSLHQMPPKPCSLTKLAQIQTVNAEEEKKIESKFPTAFSWGPLGFLEPVVDQGECGSCYIVSTMSMLTARHRIATNNPKAPPWSIAFPLYCSEYNQGCKGGYAFLASKWAHDVGLIPATCAPYTTKGKCHVNCDLSKTPRFHATEYQYVGGWYGNSSVYAIMHELHTNGPIVVSFEPSDDFMFYAGGIFMSIPTKLNMGWQKVDHAVLLVGWGEEFGQKYWLVQNSWGKEWGEKGFFRIARGQNDCGIESIAVSAKVVPDERRDVLNQFVMHAGAGKVG